MTDNMPAVPPTAAMPLVQESAQGLFLPTKPSIQEMMDEAAGNTVPVVDVPVYLKSSDVRRTVGYVGLANDESTELLYFQNVNAVVRWTLNDYTVRPIVYRLTSEGDLLLQVIMLGKPSVNSDTTVTVQFMDDMPLQTYSERAYPNV